ncbi:fatty acid-binding protein-like [Mytilus californianus]|uniref:fatty acid-binding protein-like n=1 Tax=Mytilus californianus TaxID=6549 RepID=UPI0022459BDB|nr:fatty acid-binding protein-like [Mytilus californianus]
MAQFLGKWKSVSMSNIEGVGKALGYTDEMITKYKESTWTFEFTKDGDKWSVTNESNNTPRSTNTYEEGKELETKNSFGKCLKITIKFDSDTKMTVMEKMELPVGWKNVKLVRQIEGNKMTAVMEELESGAKMTQILEKCT